MIALTLSTPFEVRRTHQVGLFAHASGCRWFFGIFQALFGPKFAHCYGIARAHSLSP